MPNLTEALTEDSKKSAVVDDCMGLIDAEVADKGGLAGLAIKAGYKAVQGVKPGFVRQVVRDHFSANAARVADALLSITDEKAKRAKSAMVKGTYDKLRGSAKKNVEAAVPRLGAMIDKHGP